MTHRTPAVRLRVLGRRARRAAWRLLKQHYVTLGSVAIISVLFALVMTSDSFVSQEGAGARQRPATADGRSAFGTPAQRYLVLFFVVQDQQQLTSMSQAFGDDQGARAGGPLAVDHVVYLIAGTEKEESDTIARLNFEALLVQGSNVDMKVVDVRGRFPTP